MERKIGPDLVLEESESGMNGDDKIRQMLEEPRQADGNREPSNHGGDQPHPAHATRAQVDEEIAAMQQRSRRQTATLEPPPELPPAPPRKALMMVGVAMLILLLAGALTLISHESHERALAKETELQTIPTVVVIHPQPEQPDEELVLPGSLLAEAEQALMPYH